MSNRNVLLLDVQVRYNSLEFRENKAKILGFAEQVIDKEILFGNYFFSGLNLHHLSHLF
jgi:hypothetical protein